MGIESASALRGKIHRLQSEVHELEHVIGLHIHNRMAVQSKVAERRGLHEASKERSAARERRLGAEEKKKYETLAAHTW